MLCEKLRQIEEVLFQEVRGKITPIKSPFSNRQQSIETTTQDVSDLKAFENKWK